MGRLAAHAEASFVADEHALEIFPAAVHSLMLTLLGRRMLVKARWFVLPNFATIVHGRAHNSILQNFLHARQGSRRAGLPIGRNLSAEALVSFRYDIQGVAAVVSLIVACVLDAACSRDEPWPDG